MKVLPRHYVYSNRTTSSIQNVNTNAMHVHTKATWQLLCLCGNYGMYVAVTGVRDNVLVSAT